MLFKKLLRDLIKNKAQFFSVFLMSFLGIYVFVGIDSETTGLTKCEEEYYTETNLADLWVEGGNFSEENLGKIRDIAEIADAELRIQMDGKVDDVEEHSMQMTFLEKGDISKLWIVEGEPYSPGKRGVYLDYVFAKKNKYKVGDTISLKLDKTIFDVIVAGIVYSPEHVYYLENTASMMPAYGDYGFCFMDVAEYPLEDKNYNQIVIDAEKIDNLGRISAAEKAEAEYLTRLIKDKIDDEKVAITGKDDRMSYQTFKSEMDQHTAMAWAFPIVFVMISILGIITTMTRLMSRQRIQIGTMKALGFGTGDIIAHYITYGFFLSLTGSVLGAIVGYYTLPDYIIAMFTSTYLLPVMKKGFSGLSLLVILFEIFVATLITYLACKKECSLIPAEALKPEAPKTQKVSAIERSRLWHSMDFSAQWNIRDILRNKVRTFMGMAGALGCSMLLLCALGCLDTMSFITHWMYGELITADYRIVMAENTPYECSSEYAKQYSGQMLETCSITLQSDKGSKTGTLTVVDAGNYYHFQDEFRRHIVLSKGDIAITYKMAESLGVGVGDFITFNIMGEDEHHKLRVSQIYRDPSTQGLAMPREVFERLDCKFVPTEILTNMTVPSSLADKEEIVGVQNTAEMMKSMDAMMEMMYSMAAILITAAVVLGIVVLYNLGTLSMVEKRREMATLKVLGFSAKGVRGILAWQNTVITVIGILLGFPAGLALLKMLYGDMPESMDYFEVVYMKSYVITFIGTFLISWAVNMWLSKEVKTIDMVEALKGIE